MITKLLFETRVGDRILALFERLTGRALELNRRPRLVALEKLQ
jgi:hypothetical protein